MYRNMVGLGICFLLESGLLLRVIGCFAVRSNRFGERSDVQVSRVDGWSLWEKELLKRTTEFIEFERGGYCNAFEGANDSFHQPIQLIAYLLGSLIL